MNLLSIIQSITFLGIVKFFLVTLLVVYSVFSLLMMRQIASMTRAVTMQDDFVIRLLGIANFVFAIIVLLMAIFFI